MNMMQSEHRTDPGLATALRISVSRLARRLRVERAAAGLGAPHPSDRRQVVLTATEAGRDLVLKARRKRDAWLARRLNELSPAERTTLRAAAPILEKLSQS